jgi:hypothetical protein
MVRAIGILTWGLFLQGLHAGEWTPVQYPLERYEHVWKSAPFIAASEVTPQGESITQRYVVTGLARVGKANVVFLFDRKNLSRFSIGTGAPSENVELVEVSNSEELSLLRVRIKSQGQVAEVGFDASVAALEPGNPSLGQASAVSAPPVLPSSSSVQAISPPVANVSASGNKPVRIIRRKPIDVP